MIPATISESVQQRREKLSERLLQIGPLWNNTEKTYWCITNDYTAPYINRTYLKGEVQSIPIAEKIIEAIEAFMKHNNIPDPANK